VFTVAEFVIRRFYGTWEFVMWSPSLKVGFLRV